ncbi:Kinesin-like calmodulin-binding protein [Diplonema papillatum]|nr:Kinesin-like calmodulin-binding protein [Diplonema papillatum]
MGGGTSKNKESQKNQQAAPPATETPKPLLADNTKTVEGGAVDQPPAAQAAPRAAEGPAKPPSPVAAYTAETNGTDPEGQTDGTTSPPPGSGTPRPPPPPTTALERQRLKEEEKERKAKESSAADRAREHEKKAREQQKQEQEQEQELERHKQQQLKQKQKQKDMAREAAEDGEHNKASSSTKVAGDKQKKKKLLNGTNIEFRYPSGSRYVGGFREGKLHGYGKYTYYPSGDEYEGEWWNDMKHGHGTYTYESGDKYVGEWRYGKKHGKGNYTFASGDEYVGSWKADRIYGYGVFVIVRNGNRYEGEWEDSYRHGYGVLISGNGDRYEGHWVRGKEEGHGILSYATGNHYCGEWKVGQMDGRGVLIEAGVRHLVEHISGYMISNTVVANDADVGPEWSAVWQLADMHQKKLDAQKDADRSNVQQETGKKETDQTELSTELTKLKLEHQTLQKKYDELLAQDAKPGEDASDASILDMTDMRERISELQKRTAADALRIKEYQAREETTKATSQELDFTKQKLAETAIELSTLKKEVEKAQETARQATQRENDTREAAASGEAVSDPQAEKKVRALEAELAKLRAGMDKTSNKDSLELQARVELLESEVSDKDAKLKQNESLQAKFASLQEREKQLSVREADLLKEIKELKAKLEKVTDQLEAVQAHHRDELDTTSKDMTSRLEEKDTKLKEIEEKAKKNKRKAKDLEGKLKVAEQAENQQKRLATELEEVRATLKSQEQLSKDSDSIIADLKSQVQQLDSNNGSLKEASESLESKVEALENVLKTEKSKSRKLFNTIEDMKGKIRVYARTRPFLHTEAQRGDKNVLTFPDDMVVEVFDDDKMKEKKEFVFDTTFPDDASQERVFEDCKHLVQSAADGFNVCIFAYGQTGSGKTFTLAGSQDNPGVAPRAMQEVFNVLEGVNVTYKVMCYMVELYNDKLFDLFRFGENPDTAPKLEIKKDARGTVSILGATILQAKSYQELHQMYVDGQTNRHTRATKMNDSSSRSHLVFSMVIETYNRDSKQTAIGKLSIVDLAGSERLAKTGIEDPTAIAEAQNINLSLTALGNVISALSSGKGHVPYRDNKLTMLMSDSLGGNAKTLMFVNISPAGYNTDETANSLNYASRVKLIKNTPSKALVTAEIKRLRATIEKLKQGLNVDADFQDVENGLGDTQLTQATHQSEAPPAPDTSPARRSSSTQQRRPSRTPSPMPKA